MWRKILAFLFIVCSVCVQGRGLVLAEDIDLYAQSAVLMDADSGRILYEKDGSAKLPMASTTKIMTLTVALESGNPDDVVEVSKLAASQPDVQLNIRTGEKYLLRDLLYSLMLESHNDVAVAVAEHIGGSVEGFADMMNQKARDIGAFHTHFVTPNGLDSDEHYTTASDLALIARYAIKNEKFIEITNTPSYSFSDIDGARSFTVNNKDAFLTQMDGAIGIKTGFTGKAGYCFVGALKRDDRTFISVVLACGWPPHKTWKWADTQKLMNYGLDNYEYRHISEDGKTFDPVSVEDGQIPTVDLRMEKQDLNLLMRPDEQVNVEYEIPDVLKAPVEEGAIVGNVQYYVAGELYQVTPIYAAGSVSKIDFRWCLEKVLHKFLYCGGELLPL
ncbi:D-alanyl-D-alanine carboxypeptidase family protein [Diplocloster hominis]|uniref:D-alanyl-D-alanine carboxypeptidase family protein n=1 Tax=Diplocloster hominis TaxID=3079010 RepID=UPI0031BA797F